jgi:N-methylhydantoinase A
LGLVLADVRHDYVTTRIQLLEEVEPGYIESVFEALENQAQQQLQSEGIPNQARHLVRSCDLRYLGQGYEVNIPVVGKLTTEADLELIARDFHALHRRAYGHAMEGDPVEFVNYRVSAVGLSPKPGLAEPQALDSQSSPEAGLKGKREVYLADDCALCSVYERKDLKPGNHLEGPAIVEQAGSTTLIYPDYSAHVDVYGNLIVTMS